ncbi:MAG: TonB-dependent receptor [Gammaproteobacteria bacterium]|nr:TonB-dependent receptor [Gammaproteobacteria bacterium]
MNNPLRILVALSAGLVASPSFATSNMDTLDQIIVTGSRAPISAGDIGSAVTIITRQDIDRRQVRYVSDLLRAVPGFSVSHTGVVGAQTQVRVRGSEANQVLVLIDGVRANDPATGDEFRWEFLATANIERIEIVRGPQSALWGSDAIGGVVHIITKSGRDAPGVGGYLEAGSENTLNAAMNGGFGGDTWSVVVGVEQLATDGSNISRSGSENDDSDITTGSLNARFKPSDRIAVQLGLRTVDAYSQFDAVDFVETGLPTDSDVATDTAQRLAQLGVTLGSSENRVRHHLNARYFDSDNRDLTDGFAAASSTSDRLNLGYQADIRIGKNLLAIALEHEKTNFEQRGEIVWGDPNQDQEMDVMSVVTDFQGRATDNVTYLLSARFDDNSDFDNVVTGRASIAWDVSDATTLRANIGTGQKTPTFIERFGYFPGQFKGNPALKPEQSLSYDIGLDQRIAASAVIQIAVFEQEIEDEIDGFIFDPDTLLYTADNLSTTSKRSGVELGARWTVSEQLDLTMNYTYTDATENGAIELRRPRHAGSMQANYSFMSARGHIALAADYGGTRRDMFFPPWPNPSELVTLGNYWLLDLTAQFQLTESVRLFARASNLLDTDYEQVYGYRTPGRAAYAGVQVNFGQ